jgi:two-component system CheB/CheR fusion protein
MPGEVEALHQDILINATSLFRDPDGFAALQDEVFPELCRDRGCDDVVRIWAVGCSTGEEAYSLAIAFTEYLELAGAAIAFQVFGTDIDGAAIDRARAGFFPRAIAHDMLPERLERFFTEVDGGYRIGGSIREKCLFARHDALADPPFSRIDLVACRNMLSDLTPAAQKTLLSVLHYALREPGYLWLGSADAALGRSRLFVLQDSQHRNPLEAGHAERTGLVAQAARPGPRDRRAPRPAPRDGPDPARPVRARRRGREPGPGDPAVPRRHERLPRARRRQGAGRRAGARWAAGRRGARDRARVSAWSENALTHERLTLQSADGPREIDVVALPMQSGEPGDLLVLFEEQAHRVRADAQLRALALTRDPASGGEELPQLRAELAATRDRLQAVIEEQEIVNRELLSATEEVQSGNQELQSINSELAASKKALQASNEELASVNYELQQRNLDLAESNGDLTNLFASVQMPIVILDRDLRVRRYTPVAERVLELSAGDIGRRIGDVELEVQVPDLEALLLDALRSTRTQECEVRDRSGHSYLLRVRPYRTLPGEVQGVVLVFVDTEALKRNESVLRESESRFERIADSAPVLIWVNDLQGCRFVNRAYEEFAGISGKELSGFEWAQLVHPADREDYVNAYTQAFAQRATFEHKFRFRRADGEYRWMMSIAQPRFLGQGEFIGYVGCTYDITEMQRAQSAWQEIDRRKNEFLATLGHELRNPLAAVKNAAYLLARAKAMRT